MTAWTQTPTKWYPLPIAVGALLLVAIQYKRKSKQSSAEVELDDNGQEVIRLKGPWQVHVLGTLPLRSMSRLWGYVNSLELPVWLRPYGFKLFAYTFGCNLEEVEYDLPSYISLGDFFYRRLKPGSRPVADALLVSPADGRMLHFGRVDVNGGDSGELLGPVQVEQVKGITYSLDALLGVEWPDSPDSILVQFHNPDSETINHQEFANLNGIEYSLDQLIGSTSGTSTPNNATSNNSKPLKFGDLTDASVVEPDCDMTETLKHDTNVAHEMGIKPTLERRLSASSVKSLRPGHSLFFAVIYLAPGDYHRFHSPAAWVVEKRRHFAGELFSVSPYIAKRLKNLFILNERVSLLGRWKYGFFSMVPVGATNVGSIKINFDKDLRTNERGSLPPVGTYSEAVYSMASPILRGQPLERAREMGGFCLGSTIVLVFEAPSDFQFVVGAGEKVKVGQRLGDTPEKLERLEDGQLTKVRTEVKK